MIQDDQSDKPFGFEAPGIVLAEFPSGHLVEHPAERTCVLRTHIYAPAAGDTQFRVSLPGIGCIDSSGRTLGSACSAIVAFLLVCLGMQRHTGSYTDDCLSQFKRSELGKISFRHKNCSLRDSAPTIEQFDCSLLFKVWQSHRGTRREVCSNSREKC